jgi:hypothetical protein
MELLKDIAWLVLSCPFLAAGFVFEFARDMFMRGCNAYDLFTRE